MKKLLLFLMMIPMIVSSQYTSKNNGNWVDGSTWLLGVAPPLTGGSKLSDDVTISEPTQVTLGNSLEVQSGSILIVEGLLTVAGNITFKNGSSILVTHTGILHILSSGANANNSTDVIINGQMIVDGDFEAGAGSTIEGDGTVDIGGTSSGDGTIFGLGTGCTGCSFGGGTLPIDLISFEATEYNNTINLRWVVASQVNNDFYTIQKSYDAYNWVSVVEVEGAGTTNTVIEYEWVDENIVYGTVYYMLRQTDYDANYEDFSPIAVTILDPDRHKEVIHTINLSGAEVDNKVKGFIINIYNDGSVEKKYNNE